MLSRCGVSSGTRTALRPLSEALSTAAAPLPPVLSPQTNPHFVRYPAALIQQFLSPRVMQTNFGELDSFALGGADGAMSESLEELDRKIAARGDGRTVFVVDSSEDDFGSRANFGRGHDMKALAAGCPTSYEVFARRLMNIAVNSLNADMAHSICLIGSINSADLTAKCIDLHASQGTEQREELIRAVQEHHRRLTDVVARVFACGGRRAKGMYLVNGDHNHMLSAIAGVRTGTGIKPVVVYIDLHADSRPVEDGPHSGTWCAEAFTNEWMEQAYVVGLNALANSGPTIQNLDDYGAVYRDYTWDRIKSGDSSLETAAIEIARDITGRYGSDVPVILSICGDSVLGLPSSAGTGAIGYSADDVYRFIALVSRRCKVCSLTVAELKTSLQPTSSALIGEFLTQCLHIYHENSK